MLEPSDLNKALRFDPEHATAYYCRGRTWFQKGNYNQAVMDLDKSIRFDPENTDASVQSSLYRI